MTEQDRPAASTSQTLTQGGTKRKTGVSPRRHCISAKQSGEGWITNETLGSVTATRPDTGPRVSGLLEKTGQIKKGGGGPTDWRNNKVTEKYRKEKNRRGEVTESTCNKEDESSSPLHASQRPDESLVCFHNDCPAIRLIP